MITVLKMKIPYTIKRTLEALLVFIMIIAVVLLLIWWNPLAKTQLLLSNFLYQESETDHPIAIVAIDNKSRNINQGLGEFKDWRRTYYAKVIENLQKHQPSAIGIDIFFDNPSKGISAEDVQKITQNPLTAFSELLKYTGEDLHPDDKIFINTLNEYDNIVSFARYENVGGEPRILYPFFKNIENVKIGIGTVESSEDGIIREITNYVEETPAFSIALLEAANLEYSLPKTNNKTIINYRTKVLQDLDSWLNNRNIRIIPFVDVYNENYPEGFSPEYFKDKIVLIGVYDKGLGDAYFTPIDPNNAMFGVQIHAQAIQTILDGAFLRNMTTQEQAIAAILMALIATASIFTLKARYAFGIIIAAGAAYFIAAPYIFRQGLILNLVYPPITLIIALIIGYAYRFLTEFKQKSLLHSALGRYVNKDIANQAIEDPSQIDLNGEKREITVLFTDIKDFTGISEKLHPQNLVNLLNEYFQVMAGIITKHGGTIDKFEGDAIMAFFGAPTPQNNHAIRACEAALEMRTALKPLLDKWHQDPSLPNGDKKPDLDFRVGISTGEAIVGNIGFEDHIEYTAMGDIVNLGSRLESANKKYQTHIMISDATLAQIDGLFDVRFVDVIRVKGKQNATKVYELLCTHGNLSSDQREILRLYNQGVRYYFDRKFIEALDEFNKVLELHPRDFLSDIYAGRCEILKRYPPTHDWDFVYTMESK
ncbi:CHASE2 domain-containing protein [Candidatus Peregrinibacteria bacterium]|nr:CHASE2 domain-containing protein [Candidatus Peregrinibacteria bacterium]